MRLHEATVWLVLPTGSLGWLALAVVTGTAGCGKSNDVDASQSVTAQCLSSNTDLARLCPAGTALDSHASANDPGACMDDTTSGEAGLQSVCRVEGQCAVQCRVILDCNCGASLITREEVQCLKCTTCGNRTVEDGEECDLGVDNGRGKGCDNNCQLTEGSCGSNGDLRCSQDSREVQVCTDGIWLTKTACTSDESCDTSSYQCETVADYCATPGEERCVGDYQRQKCGADNRWADEPCPGTAPKCSTTGGVVQCVAGADDSVSANFRMNRKQVVIGGLCGYGSSSNYRVQLGPVKK